ncbi:hypothetical protein ABI_41210 [Asticcacaulis biprosthecium C19]|uniref:Tetratricopeptide repeat family protein n=1 Tax=Asticcacaulis biprosthecium C19 TaxID=715226 RepID=F4QSH8_9CAUL|nr:hypothetical protein [Asticcacaulis biprosthecium]EGF89698.1 hypothetical protein ABI_41210 [Asticcacaulis biprosthecium C19]
MSAKTKLAALIAVAVLASAGAANAITTPAAPLSQTAQDSLFKRLEKAVTEGHAESPEGAAALTVELRSIIADPGFSLLPPRYRAGAYAILAVALSTQAQHEDAYRMLLKAGELSDEFAQSVYYDVMLSSIALLAGEDVAAINALASAYEKDPGNSTGIRSELVERIDHRASLLTDTAPRRRLLEALWAADYAHDNPLWTAQDLWWCLFELRVAAGDDEAAREVLPKLVEAKYVVAVRADNRYTRFTADLPSGGDYRAAYLQNRAETEARIAANPDLIEGQKMLSDYLASDGKFEEALALLDAALKKGRAPGEPAYSDFTDQERWVLEGRADLLGEMGRQEEQTLEHVKARDAAIAAGGDKVSQALNLGGYYNSIERPDLALKEVEGADIKSASPYGRMVAAEVRVCAYQQLEDQAHVEVWMDYLTENRLEGPTMYRTALACVGNMDGLAAMVISELEDPKTRNVMLRGLQTYDDPVGNVTPYERSMSAINYAIKVRPDVRAAIAKYGTQATYSRSGAKS